MLTTQMCFNEQQLKKQNISPSQSPKHTVCLVGVVFTVWSVPVCVLPALQFSQAITHLDMAQQQISSRLVNHGDMLKQVGLIVNVTWIWSHDSIYMKTISSSNGCLPCICFVLQQLHDSFGYAFYVILYSDYRL